MIPVNAAVDEMTPAEYARHRNVSRQAVGKAINNGRIPAAAIRGKAGRKMINVAAADLAWSSSISRANFSDDVPAGEKNLPTAAAAAPGDEGAAPAAADPTLNSARTQVALYDAERKRIELEQLQGRLLEAADVSRAMQRWAEIAVREVDQLATHADSLAGEFTRGGVDAVRRMLKEISAGQRKAIEINMRLLGDDGAGDDDQDGNA